MAETNTFSENAVRQIVELVLEEKRRSSARALGAVRRHENVMLPGVVKIVTPKSTLYAAFGGGYNANNNLDYENVEGNALAISTGNYVPLSSGSLATARVRTVYPVACYIWEEDGDGVMQNTLEEIDCVNVTGLPIMTDTWCEARAVNGFNELVATPIGDMAKKSKHFSILGTVSVDGTEAKFIRATAVPKPESTSTSEQDWAHGNSVGDVFIHHPGTYTITFGGEVVRTSSDNSDDTTWTDSGADTLDLPNPICVEIDCVHNWIPPGNLVTGWDGLNHTIKIAIPARASGKITGERTYTVTHTLDTIHGQPYLRLSLAMKVVNTLGANAADSVVQFNGGWIHIRPEGGGQYGGNEGTGYNAFLGASGAFQWWGGGSAPPTFDEDGT